LLDGSDISGNGIDRDKTTLATAGQSDDKPHEEHRAKGSEKAFNQPKRRRCQGHAGLEDVGRGGANPKAALRHLCLIR
jgi:hypothetical protein